MFQHLLEKMIQSPECFSSIAPPLPKIFKIFTGFQDELIFLIPRHSENFSISYPSSLLESQGGIILNFFSLKKFHAETSIELTHLTQHSFGEDYPFYFYQIPKKSPRTVEIRLQTRGLEDFGWLIVRYVLPKKMLEFFNFVFGKLLTDDSVPKRKIITSKLCQRGCKFSCAELIINILQESELSCPLCLQKCHYSDLELTEYIQDPEIQSSDSKRYSLTETLSR
jgi:hypothetical protein